MAGVIRKSLLSSARQISRHVFSRSAPTAHKLSPVSVSARDFGGLTSSTNARALVGEIASMSKACSSVSYSVHTEVDAEVFKFLEKEIQFEESSAKGKAGLPKIQGFDINGDDSVVTLTRKLGKETIKVTFNVNGSADSDQSASVDESDKPEDVQMVSRPPFNVELDKGTGEVLTFQCAFSPFDDIEQDSAPQDADAIVDQFEIHEVALHRGEWTEKVYAAHADTLDGNLYDLFMDMLDERGINDDFINDLVEFSTAYEHGRYVGFLKNLKSFIDK